MKAYNIVYLLLLLASSQGRTQNINWNRTVMLEPSVSELQRTVGYPEYTLIDNGTARSPVDAWDPPPGKIKFSAEDLFQVFHTECVAFVGDSLKRRAADTLHIAVEKRKNESSIGTYHYNWDPKSTSRARKIDGGFPSVNTRSSLVSFDKPCQPGTIDNLWHPTYAEMKKFGYKKNYTVVVAGVEAWDNENRHWTPRQWKAMVNDTIHHLYNTVPKSVPIYWKTSPWGWYWKWEELDEDAKMEDPKEGNNYFVYLSNTVAKEEVKKINASNLMILDWSKEILPYSFGERINTNMMTADHLISACHVGPKGRTLLLQMLASELVQWDPNKLKRRTTAVVTSNSKKVEYTAGSMQDLEVQNARLQTLMGFCLGVLVTKLALKR
eukprot:scaffold1170_cov122-Cylindrotheca_fusiformis.AAC.20